MKKLTNKEKIYSYAAILLIIDQFLKFLIRAKLPLHKEIVIIPRFFSLYNTTNTGAAFSIFQNHTIFLILFTFLILLIIDKYLQKETYFTKLSITSLGMIIGGIIGNLIDRIIYHGVTDYLLFVFGSKSFPVFNFADILITCGIFLYFISMLIDLIKNKSISIDSRNKNSQISNHLEETKNKLDTKKNKSIEESPRRTNTKNTKNNLNNYPHKKRTNTKNGTKESAKKKGALYDYSRYK